MGHRSSLHLRDVATFADRARFVGVCLALAALLAACGSNVRQSNVPTPGLRLVAETELVETDSALVGRPIALAIGTGGDYFVTDALERRVLRYDRGGRLVATFGRSGGGPGEFDAPSLVALAGDTILLTQDARRNHVTLFDLRSGAYLRDVAVQGRLGSIREQDGTVWVGLRNGTTGTGVGSWPLVGSSVRLLVDEPPSYRRNRVLAMLYGHVQVLPVGDSLVVGFTGSRVLRVTDADGATLRAFAVPALRRRGVPADLGERVLQSSSAEELVRTSSLLFGLHRLSDGSLVAVHFDQELVNGSFARTGFVSVVDRALRRACVDLPLPLSHEGMSSVAFRGDTLVTLEQEVVGERARLVTRDYVLELEGCEWLDVVTAPASEA